MENHNFTQPSTLTGPEQILGNPAAPYINSLVNPGNRNAAQVSYASNSNSLSDYPQLMGKTWRSSPSLELTA